jgi:hypothetical protein
MELRNEKGNIFWSTECEDPIAAIDNSTVEDLTISEKLLEALHV